METSNGIRAISEMKILGTDKLNLLDDTQIKEYVQTHLVEALSVVLEEFRIEIEETPTHAYMCGSHVDKIRNYLNDTMNEHNKQHPEDRREFVRYDGGAVHINGVLLKPGCDLSGAKVVIVSWRGCEENE